jgi:hypothetical protein
VDFWEAALANKLKYFTDLPHCVVLEEFIGLFQEDVRERP